MPSQTAQTHISNLQNNAHTNTQTQRCAQYKEKSGNEFKTHSLTLSRLHSNKMLKMPPK